ncbi:MAG: CidA/LrgA family protein [Thiolinea sp.]
MINALIILFGFQLLGTLAERYLLLPVPGPVLGMALLMLVLFMHKPLTGQLKPTSDVLIQYLPVLFVPAATGIITFGSLLSSDGLLLLLVLILSTLIGIVSTAWIFCKLAARWAPPGTEERAS